MSNKEKVLVSACLLGINCRYNGVPLEKRELPFSEKDVEIITFCPEKYGGLEAPRSPSFFSNKETGEGVWKGICKVISPENEDRTNEFILGANETLKLAKKHNIKKAYVKERSPSCGVNCVYVMDKREKGKGVTTALLQTNGIETIPID